MSKTKKAIIIDEEEEEIVEDTENIFDAMSENDDSIQDEDLEENLNGDDEDDDTENNECLIDKVIEDDNIYFSNLDNSEVQTDIEEIYLVKEERISSNRLTKYEMVRILGERTKQLKMGAKPLIKNYETLSYDQIAEEELKLNMTPFKIKRSLPNGKFEIWLLDELKKDHLLYLLNE